MFDELKRIMNDPSRTPEERRAAAQHILKLQQEQEQAPKGIFDDILEEDKHRVYAEEVERIAAINTKEKACPACWKRQPIDNAACDLCNEQPQRWLPAEDITSGRVPGMDEAAIQRNLNRWLSTHATVGYLQDIVANSSAMDSAWMVNHAARIIRLRGGNVPLTFWGEIVPGDEPRPSSAPADQSVAQITDEQIQCAMKWCDLELEKINAQQQKLHEQNGAV